MPVSDLIRLALLFAPISLASIGGGAAAIPAIQHEIVTVAHWATPAEFLQLFAISRAAPGPGTMLSTAIGWHVAGFAGALVATMCFFLPSSILCLTVLHVSSRFRERIWYRAVREGFAPLGTGLVLAGMMSIFRISGGGVPAIFIAAASTAAILYFPKIPTLGVLAAGGIAGVLLAI